MATKPLRPHPLLLYVLAAGLVALALGVDAAVPHNGVAAALLLPLLCVAVAAAAWWGGLGPGVVASVLAAGAALYPLFGLTPEAPWHAPAPVLIGVLLGNGLLLSYLCDLRHRAERERAANQLREQVTLDELQDAVGELRRQEQQFRVLVEKSWDAITLVRPDGTLKYASPAITRILGYSADECQDRPLVDLVYPDDRRKAAAFLADVLSQPGKSATAVYRVRHRDGSWRWVEATGTNLLHEPGILAVVCNNRDISDRKETEEALRENEERLRLALSAAEMGTWRLDLRSDLDTRDANFNRILGLGAVVTTEPMEDFFERMHPEDRPAAEAALRHAIRSRGAYDCEFRIIQPDGAVRWLRDRGRVLPNPEGLPTCMTGAAVDITERRQSEEALRDAQNRRTRQNRVLLDLAQSRSAGSGDLEAALRELTETAVRTLNVDRASVWLYHADDTAIRCLNLFERTRNRHSSGGELTASRFPAYFEALEAERTISAGDAAADSRTADFAASYLLPRGISSVLDAPVRVHGHIVGVVRHEHVGPPRQWTSDEENFAASLADLVSLALEASERRQTEQALRDSEERLRLALSAGKCGTWDWDIPGNHIVWSDRLYELHGVRPGSFGGRMEEFTALIHPDDRARVQESVRQALDAGCAYEIEFRIVQPCGAVRWLYTNGRVVHDAGGRAVRMLGATIDTTERVRAEEALREADRRKDEFLAMLAHELRNPLAPVMNAVRVLRHCRPRELDVADTLNRQREVIERQTRHLSRLVDDLLDVSRITQGRIELRKEPLDLITTVRHAVESCRCQIEERGLSLDLVLPASPVRIEADATRLEQVVWNLLSNSTKYTEPGGRVSVRVEVEEAHVTLRIRDTGKGIPTERLGDVFDLFTQVDPTLARAQGGLGIGLTMAQKLVHMHGGAIQAFSEGRGRGSEFVVSLPLVVLADCGSAAPLDSTPTPALPCRGNGSVPHREAPRRRMLVVDDNRDAADSLAELLELWGHEVRIAYDGEAALRLVAEDRPDVLLCDIGMPGLDGYEVARSLRSGRVWTGAEASKTHAEATLALAGANGVGVPWNMHVPNGTGVHPAPENCRTFPVMANLPVLVAITGYGQAADRERALEAGFDHHLTKPVDPDLLAEVLRAIT